MGCCGSKDEKESPAENSQTSAEAEKKPTTSAQAKKNRVLLQIQTD